ncbi:homoserine kinase [Candidatus Bathyarchaeota archaeon]|nr:MAG: homoserine kinase [Candidatus Bathyarchaeota archaeon]
MDVIRVGCPATVANLGAGFDIFGMALKEPYDIVEVRVRENGVKIVVEGYEVPTKPEKNTGGYVALKMLDDFGLECGVEIKIFKRIKPGSGLGSSAATASGVAYALNKLFDLRLSLNRLVEYAALGETVSAGVPHADNVAPAIYGGFTVIASRKPLKVLRFKPPSMGVVIALPDVEKGSTKLARAVVPRMVPLESMVQNVGYASILAIGMATGDISLVKMGMNDCVVEPARAKAGILKGFKLFKKAGLEVGAGVAASGAGPAIVGVVEKEKVETLYEAFKGVCRSLGLSCMVYKTEPGDGISEIEGG